MAKAKIIGTGLYAPGKAIDNEELKKLTKIEFDSGKMEGGLGIKTRHNAKLRGINESTADFATKAAEAAIKDAGIDPMSVGLFLVATDTPEYITPATALLVQGRIQKGEKFTGAFDVCASCASFVSAFDAAARMVATDETIKYAVVIGVYNMPAFIKEGDAFAYPIFADGAGAIVLERTDDKDPSGYLNGQFMADGTQWDFIGIYTGGAKKACTPQRLKDNEYGLENLKPLPGDRNLKLWPPLAKQLAAKAKIKLEDVDHFIFTQINRSVIKKVMAELGQPMEKTTCIMDKYGYTGSGCVPMAFHHAIKEGKVKKGSKVMFIASGAGFAVGSNVFVY